MARVEKNAEGVDAHVDTPDFGCIVIEETKPAAPAPAPAKGKPTAPPQADEEGAN